MAFHGWPVEALEFYEGLELDNSRAYWTAHRAVYDQQVAAPMTALLDELEPEFGAGRIYRPYRDVRFSRDKTPYKTAMGATLAGGGYVQLSAQGLAAGAGMYQMTPDQLARYRAAVAHEASGPALAALVARIERHAITVTGHETLRTAPRGYPRDHPRVGLLRHKGLIAWQEWPAAAWLGTAEPLARVTAFLRTTRPLVDWMAAHVGDPHPADGT